MCTHCLVTEMQLKVALEIGAFGNDWIIPIPSPIRRSLCYIILEKLSNTRISGKCLSFSICKIRITIVIMFEAAVSNVYYCYSSYFFLSLLQLATNKYSLLLHICEISVHLIFHFIHHSL